MGVPIDIEDVSPQCVWESLQADGKNVLVDVRTRAELTFVGVPDLASLGKRLLTVEWQVSPDGRGDPTFANRLGELLHKIGAGTDTEVFLICRSGARSLMAAETMAAAGFTRCRNVADGFEGPLDANRQRGRVAGWKAAGLPWVQG